MGFCVGMSVMTRGERDLLEMDCREECSSLNATTYNSLMKQYSINKDMKATTDIYRGMCTNGVMPDEKTYNILITGHARSRNMKEACYFHKEMVEKGFSLRPTSYNALIKGLFKKKRLIDAKSLFEEMRANGFSADKDIYDIFIDVNFSEGNIEKTLKLCDEAIEKDHGVYDTDKT
ncbi:uncharacterized protein A4U43_C08F14450 [Asparagus officinalis]|nr:uncharacterized protein A4U43_C08F14450 [Asparagus officinalis]